MNLKIGQTIYYYDFNHRIYKEGKIIKSEYYRPLVIEGENKNEYILDFGVINKKSQMLKLPREKCISFYTEEQKNNNLFIDENLYKTIDKLKSLRSSEKLKNIINILEDKV